MKRGDIVREITILAMQGEFSCVSFPFMDDEYTISCCGVEFTGEEFTTMVDVSCFPDFDDYIDIGNFSDEFLYAFYRALCDELNLIDKNLF